MLLVSWQITPQKFFGQSALWINWDILDSKYMRTKKLNVLFFEIKARVMEGNQHPRNLFPTAFLVAAGKIKNAIYVPAKIVNMMRILVPRPLKRLEREGLPIPIRPPHLPCPQFRVLLYLLYSR